MVLFIYSEDILMCRTLLVSFRFLGWGFWFLVYLGDRLFYMFFWDYVFWYI